MTLLVQIEINGKFIDAGKITGTNYLDAVFSYFDEYVENQNPPISINLPLQSRSFSSEKTKIFFDGLLPEGFLRKSVAENLHADSEDYISILKELGRECLGAVRILDLGNPLDQFKNVKSGYRELSVEEVKSLAQEGAGESASIVIRSHLSLTGASGKAGLYYDEPSKKWFFPEGEAASTHIVKQSHVRLKNIVANEHLCLLAARKLGIKTCENFIVEAEDGSIEDDTVLFATKRYDRVITENSRTADGLKIPFRLHQEDFAQALGIKSEKKYEKKDGNYLKKMFCLLKEYSANPLEDQAELWKICVFNYLVGNTDNHIKNLSILYSNDLRSLRLAPAYDIISTKVYSSSCEEMSVSINEKYRARDVLRQDFADEARNIGLGEKLALNIFDRLKENFAVALKTSAEELCDSGFTSAQKIAESILI